ncbi:MAG: hypothetical protein KDC11_07955 [Chitinophagaceae bacterium]|nr:hypothetical protein [Chitinophagaceae bacterium]
MKNLPTLTVLLLCCIMSACKKEQLSTAKQNTPQTPQPTQSIDTLYGNGTLHTLAGFHVQSRGGHIDTLDTTAIDDVVALVNICYTQGSTDTFVMVEYTKGIYYYQDSLNTANYTVPTRKAGHLYFRTQTGKYNYAFLEFDIVNKRVVSYVREQRAAMFLSQDYRYQK